MLKQWRIPRTQVSTVNSTSAILAAVAHRLGATCLPRSAAEDALTLGRVAQVHLDPAPPARQIHLIRLAARPLSLVEEFFVERIHEEGNQ